MWRQLRSGTDWQKLLGLFDTTVTIVTIKVELQTHYNKTIVDDQSVQKPLERDKSAHEYQWEWKTRGALRPHDLTLWLQECYNSE